MSTPELQLLSRIVRTGDLKTVIDWGITVDDFNTGESRAYYSHILAMYNNPETLGTIPGLVTITTLFPNLAICDDDSMTTAALCHALRSKRILLACQETAHGLAEKSGVNAVSAINEAQSRLSQLQSLHSSKSTDIPFSESVSSIRALYERRKNGLVDSVATWPWDPFNEASAGGIAPDDFVIIYGRPKNMKTWVLTSLIADLYNQGKRILVYTKEMTPLNISMRIAACMSYIPYQELRNGQLSPADEARFMDTADSIANSRNDTRLVCLSGQDVASGGDTVAWLRSKVDTYKPDVVFIDGMYLMSDGRGGRSQDWLRVTNVSRDVRSMILATKIPTFATLQANRGAAKNTQANTDEIAYADAVGQDATLVLRTIVDKNSPTISLIVGASREFALDGIKIWGIPATNFGFHSIMEQSDIDKAKALDNTREDPKAKPLRTPVRKQDTDKEIAKRVQRE